jgi:hypothetical protein
MMRRALWAALAALGLCTLAALWFFDNVERAPVKRHEGMKAEALRNPFLAAERLFSRLGRKVTRIRRSADLDALTAGGDGVLILIRMRQRAFTPKQEERLLQWVERGAYLIADVEFSGKDSNFLAEAFGVEPSGKDGSPASGKKASAKPYVEVVLPGDPLRYRLASGIVRGLAAVRAHPEWHASGQNGEEILHYAHGRGNVTLVSGLHFLNNRRIGHFDHAELAWALLQRYQPGGAVHLATRLEYPSLGQWLAESAWMALASFALLAVLWLWSVIPRFGGLRAAPDAARRDLAQHLLAIGRSLWREGGLDSLRALVRREVAQRLALRHPALARRLAGERRAALARMTGLDEREIREALDDKHAPSPESFTRTMWTLQRLEQKL